MIAKACCGNRPARQFPIWPIPIRMGRLVAPDLQVRATRTVFTASAKVPSAVSSCQREQVQNGQCPVFNSWLPRFTNAPVKKMKLIVSRLME